METYEQFRNALGRLAAYRADTPVRRPTLTLTSGSTRPVPAGTTASPPRPGTLASAAAALRSGATTAVQLVEQTYAAIERWNNKVNAFEYVVPRADALRAAEALDRLAPAARGPLWGIPVSIKDVLHVAGLPTTASSRTLSNHIPTEDAEGVARLRQAGAIIVGKTTTHEYAMGVTTPHSRNPWDLTRDPGGSSGGAAITLATGMALGALGTDTRASIRVPAALCGTVGFKPTFGLVSTHGVVTMSWSMDHVAPMARTCEDVAILLETLVGPDTKDPSTVARPVPNYRSWVGAEVRGLRLGIPLNGLRNAEPAVRDAFQRTLDGLRARGVVTVDLEEPTVADFELANAAGLIVSRCEALPIQRALLGPGPHPYNTDVREQLEEAGKVLAVDYLEALRFRGELAERMGRLFERVDALALPTSRVVAPLVAESDQYLLVLSENCVPWSFIGFPAVSVPCGVSSAEQLPIGIEFVAAPFDDGLLLTLGSAVEAAHPLPELRFVP